MPMVETVRTIPVIVENSPRKIAPDKMETEEISGYPFERNPDEGFRTQLDDIAKRHPELAEHLNTFQQRDRARSDTSTFPRRLPRHFGRGFEGFSGFPFDNEDLAPREFQQEHQEFHQPHQESHQGFRQEPHQGFPQEPHQAFYQQQPQPEEKVGKEKGNNIQQSSTIDLGQKQEPINDRGKRSMSAPPAEKSEANLNQETMSNHNKPPSTNERIIPIHIEGRDEPVLPRNVNQTYTQQSPQPDRIFGQRPEQFTQFLNRDSGPRYNNWQQQQQPHQEDQHHRQARQDIPIPVQREVPVQKKQQQQQQKAPQPQRGASPQPEASKQNQQQQQPPQQQQQQPQQQPKQPSTPLDQIQAIQKDVLELMSQVEAFDGKTKDKQYLYLDEMLTRNLIKLDNVDTQGQETIRSARKEAIKCIERAISILEAKATSGSQETMEVEKQEEQQHQQEQDQDQKESMEIGNSDKEMEVEVPKEENKDVNMEDAKKEEEEVKNIEEVSNMSVGEAVKIFEEKNNQPENANNESNDNKQQEAVATEEMKNDESEAVKKDENVECDAKKEEEKAEPAEQDCTKKEKKKGKKKVVDKKESK